MKLQNRYCGWVAACVRLASFEIVPPPPPARSLKRCISQAEVQDFFAAAGTIGRQQQPDIALGRATKKKNVAVKAAPTVVKRRRRDESPPVRAAKPPAAKPPAPNAAKPPPAPAHTPGLTGLLAAYSDDSDSDS